MLSFDAMAALPYRWGKPSISARFKQSPQDFVVDEQLGYDPPGEGEGEHLWLRLRKTGQNTEWLAKQLARHFKRPLADVGYAGLKDRQAVASQWFSLRLADAAALNNLSIPNVELLAHCKAQRKLQTGGLQSNRFVIRLGDLTGQQADQVAQRVEALSGKSVPNYFAAQRFGHAANNLLLLRRWQARQYRPRSRYERGLLISSLRAWLFNLQLAAAVRAEQSPNQLYLPGAVRHQLPETLLSLEAVYQHDMRWLAEQGCRLNQRDAWLCPSISLKCEGSAQLLLEFELPKGAYATALLRELVQLRQSES